MTRLGIFGGTFDPVHLGHTGLACQIQRLMELDTIHLLPCLSPPHKTRLNLTPGADRLAMLALATRQAPKLIPSSLELQREAPSYTIDTLRQIQNTHPQASLFFLMGMDSFLELNLWKEYERLTEEFHLVVFQRPGYTARPGEQSLPPGTAQRIVKGNLAAGEKQGCIHMVETTEYEISSTTIRLKAQRGESLEGLVAPAVESYLQRCHLYPPR